MKRSLSPVLVLVVALICALVWPVTAMAQQQKSTSSSRRKRLSEMNELELTDAGFEWEAQNAYAGSWQAGAVATLPGFMFHGLGHFYAKDRDTGWSLLASEAVGVALMLGGSLVYFGADDNSAPGKGGMAVAQVGGGVFMLGYLGDVIGAFKGSNRELLPVSVREVGVGARAQYSFMLLKGLRLHNLLEAKLELDFGSFYMKPYTSLDPLLDFQLYGGVLGLRAVRGEAWNFLALQARVERASFTEASGGQSISEDGSVRDSVLRAQVETVVSLDLGQFIPHLRHLVSVSTIGVGFADGAGSRAALPGTESRAYFVLNQALMFNVDAGLTLRPHYTFSEAELLRPLDVGLGIVGADVVLRPGSDLEILMGLEVAQGFALNIGVTWWWSGP